MHLSVGQHPVCMCDYADKLLRDRSTLAYSAGASVTKPKGFMVSISAGLPFHSNPDVIKVSSIPIVRSLS